MSIVFLVCAALGGTVLVCQFVMTLMGLGDDGADLADDFPDDLDTDIDAETADHGSTWLFGVISFRTLVAASTFFGLGGMAAESAHMSVPLQLLIALMLGATAMYGVHWLMLSFYKLSADGTLRIQRAVGKSGKVYIPIPGGKSGAGKIQLNVQNRLIEYEAITSHDEKLPTGARVVVVGVTGNNTLEVKPVSETAQTTTV